MSRRAKPKSRTVTIRAYAVVCEHGTIHTLHYQVGKARVEARRWLDGLSCGLHSVVPLIGVWKGKARK